MPTSLHWCFHCHQAVLLEKQFLICHTSPSYRWNLVAQLMQDAVLCLFKLNCWMLEASLFGIPEHSWPIWLCSVYPALNQQECVLTFHLESAIFKHFLLPTCRNFTLLSKWQNVSSEENVSDKALLILCAHICLCAHVHFWEGSVCWVPPLNLPMQSSPIYLGFCLIP